jgi:hypothetical protein
MERNNLYSDEPELANELRLAFMAWSQSVTSDVR